jgi:hypothetical protein
MKNFVWKVVFAILGIAIVLLSAMNEGGTTAGAGVVVVYSAVVAAFVALFENQALEKPGKEIGMDVLEIIVASILGALAYTIF